MHICERTLANMCACLFLLESVENHDILQRFLLRKITLVANNAFTVCLINTW